MADLFHLPNRVDRRLWPHARHVALALSLALALTSRPGRCDAPAEPRNSEGPLEQPLATTLLDLQGVAHSLRPQAERHGLALVFLSTECPIANGYLPELNRLFAEQQMLNPRIGFFGVISDRTVSRAAAVKHSQEYKIAFPILFDNSGELAEALQPSHTPEAFVLDRAGKIAYRGRIDDAYAALGKRRAQVNHHDLRDAMAAVAENLPVSDARTEPVGCRLEQRRVQSRQTAVTYARDIAPLLQANCMSCHREGEVAPFPLTTFEHAAKRAEQLADVVASRFMPPWKPEPGYGHLAGERRMTSRQIELLRQWADAGAPAGNSDDLPPSPKFADGWVLGEPDLVIKVPEPFDIPAEGRDVFRNFVIPLALESDQLVSAVEFRPGNRRVVHHALFFLDSSGVARQKDAADAGPGYSTFGGPGIVPTGALGGWAPGGTPRSLPEGMGRLLRKGSDLVIQVHYHPSGKPEQDQSTVGIHFVKGTASQVVGGLLVLDRSLAIPAGTRHHSMTGSYTLPSTATLLGLTPHMHLLGREMRVTATLPDGKVEPLIHIKDWNFNWQDQYLLAEPLQLPKGTRLDVLAAYDNSEDNPLNPNSPPKRVTWGEQTTDEMFICFFQVTTDRREQLRPLMIDNLLTMGRRGFLRGEAGRWLRSLR